MEEVKILFSEEAEKTYQFLKKRFSKIDNSLLNAIDKKSEIIKMNPRYGNPIAKKLIPQEYKLKYGIKNLFRVEFPNYWRMLYSLENESQIKIVAFVVDIINHKTYNKKFRYK
jgi:hypothetical protein